MNESINEDNLAMLRPDSSVGVDVVLQCRDCLEHTRADGTLVRSFFRMRLHVSSQQVALGTSVVAVVAHQVCTHSGGGNCRSVHLGILQQSRTNSTGNTVKSKWQKFQFFIITYNIAS